MKIGRQAKIIELIREHEVETQEELCELLTKAGFQATQATVSRDIRELRLTKVPCEGGRQKYAVMEVRESDLLDKYTNVLTTGLISMEGAGNLLVIKTVSGMAMAVAAAIDGLDVPGIVGSIAGDDTIMCAEKTVEMVEETMRYIQQLTNR